MPIFNPGSPVAASSIQQLLFKGSSLNFQLTTDQVLTKVYAGSAYIVTGIYARQRSGAASVVCAGGVYDTAAKGGNAVVAAAQSWVTLASGIIVNAALAALAGTTLLTNTLILSLTTGSTAACTADLYVIGLDVS
jgi:hypothetical protein